MPRASGLPVLRRLRGPLIAAGLGLLALIGWEASGADLWMAALYGGPGGFPLRHAWVTEHLLHDGGRRVAGAVLIALIVHAAWPGARVPSRRERLYWLGVVFVGLLLVPTLKRFSASSCPYDLAMFGGGAPWIPHWRLGVADGGPGHCFPSGHAVSAFAFFAVWGLWREHRPWLARTALALVLLAGAAFGWAQLARGAHFVSHTLWSAWLCWAVTVVALGWAPPAQLPDRPPPPG